MNRKKLVKKIEKTFIPMIGAGEKLVGIFSKNMGVINEMTTLPGVDIQYNSKWSIQVSMEFIFHSNLDTLIANQRRTILEFGPIQSSRYCLTIEEMTYSANQGFVEFWAQGYCRNAVRCLIDTAIITHKSRLMELFEQKNDTYRVLKKEHGYLEHSVIPCINNETKQAFDVIQRWMGQLDEFEPILSAAICFNSKIINLGLGNIILSRNDLYTYLDCFIEKKDPTWIEPIQAILKNPNVSKRKLALIAITNSNLRQTAKRQLLSRLGLGK